MRLVELFPEDDLSQLEEGPLKTAIMRGLTGAALGSALAAGVANMPPKLAPASKPSEITRMDQDALASIAKQATEQGMEDDQIGDLIDRLNKTDTDDSVIHPGFPTKLIGQDKRQPAERISTFVSQFKPYIEAENDKILAERSRLIRDIKHLNVGNKLSDDERKFVGGLMQKYGAKDLKELLERVDVIPTSMALAQAAIESGWGTADLAQSANVFYGQKVWDKSKGVRGIEGERYAAFNSPSQSVSAYMRNLNTHRAYSEFRKLRANLRKTGKKLTGLSLIPTLEKYSDLGAEYINRVSKLLKNNYFSKLDL